jgi:DNA polymerase-3 subunit epsilon
MERKAFEKIVLCLWFDYKVNNNYYLYRYLRRFILENGLAKHTQLNIPCITQKQAEAKSYLCRADLETMHLMPTQGPVAYSIDEGENIIFYFSYENVDAIPIELFLTRNIRKQTMTLQSGREIERMSVKRAASFGYYTEERLKAMNYEPIEEPVAYTIHFTDKTVCYFFDKKTALKLPMMCIRCLKNVRYKRKLCQECYEEDLAIRRAEGDKLRGAYYNAEREKTLFFDLELTGFYDRDEILSISIVDGNGKIIMDTIIKPAHTKKWKKTEKIHGITPEMTEGSPTLEELTPKIKELFDGADALIAYGVSTDYSHIKYIYNTEEERAELYKKIRCCANEFVRYIYEHRPDIVHASLTDAMLCYDIEWEGTAHTSIADTVAVRKVWEKLFPNYYKD